MPPEIAKLHDAGFALIRALHDTEAESLGFTLEGVTYNGENIGNYEINVKKI